MVLQREKELQAAKKAIVCQCNPQIAAQGFEENETEKIALSNCMEIF